jgi:hypothetical protein
MWAARLFRGKAGEGEVKMARDYKLATVIRDGGNGGSNQICEEASSRKPCG